MVPYLYVAGASYSGSTLLAFLLNAHPQMMSVSEVCGVIPHANIPEDAIESYMCSCGEPLLACPFYVELDQRIRAAGSTFDLRDWRTHFRIGRNRWVQALATRPLPSLVLQRLRHCVVQAFPGVRARTREVALRNVRFAQAALAISGMRVFVDAQKDAARVQFLSKIPELDLRVMHLVRDVRGSAASYMKHYPERNDARTATKKWMRANQAAARALYCVPPDRRMTMRYDELCTDHQGALRRIAEFAGVSPATIPADFRGQEHHIVGNQMRTGNSQEIRKDESWKTRLTADNLEIIRRVGGAANRRFGFDWPNDDASATSVAPTRS
jgi:hypothetical protein